MHLNPDDEGQCHVHCGAWRYDKADFHAELAKTEVALKAIDDTLESVYGETYVAKKREGLRRAGIPLLHIEIEPEDLSVN